MPTKKRKFYPISDEKTLKKAVSSLSKGYKEMARLILITGIKLSEICNLELENLDIENNRIVLNNGKTYVVPKRILNVYLKEMRARFHIGTAHHVFVNEDENPITHRMFQRQMDKLEEFMGIPMSYQLLRLTYQYRLYQATHDGAYLRTKGQNASKASLSSILGIEVNDEVPIKKVTADNECEILMKLYI